MSKVLWVVGGAALAGAAYLLLKDPSPAYVPADGVDAAAARVGAWGTKQRVSGTGNQLLGKVEQGAGALTGSHDLSDQGAFDTAAGAVQDAAGKVAQAVEDTVHNLNRG